MKQSEGAKLFSRIRRAFDLANSRQGRIRQFASANIKLATYVAAVLGLGSLLMDYGTDELGDTFQLVQPSHLKFIALPILLIGFAWLAGYFSDFVAAFRETDTSARRSLFRNISVYDSTSRLVNKADIEGSRADGAIQLFSHPYNDLRIEDNGWSTDEVEFELTSRELRVASVSRLTHDSQRCCVVV